MTPSHIVFDMKPLAQFFFIFFTSVPMCRDSFLVASLKIVHNVTFLRKLFSIYIRIHLFLDLMKIMMNKCDGMLYGRKTAINRIY